MAQTIAGRFSLLDPIAQGGSGAVWIARDERFGTVCAAKVLQQRDSASLLRFVRENTVRLDHPHVLAPYTWAAEDADVVIGMPLITGGTLDQALKDQGALSPRLVLAILQQCLLGLEAVHAAGWIHRDIKPGNIMFDAEQERLHVVIADFGIALHADDARLTHAGLVYGTPGYVAPEVMSGAAPDPGQDIWALGQCGKRMAGAEYGLDELRRAGGESAILAELLGVMTAADPRSRISAAQASAQLATMDLSGPYTRADGGPFAVLRVVDSPSLPRQPQPGLAQVPAQIAGSPLPGAGRPGAGQPGGSGQLSGNWQPGGSGPGTAATPAAPPTGVTAPGPHAFGGFPERGHTRSYGEHAQGHGAVPPPSASPGFAFDADPTPPRGRRSKPLLITAGVVGVLGIGLLGVGAVGLTMI